MLSVFSFCFFLCLVWRLLPFFAVLLFLGSLFEKFFGSELLFLGLGVGFLFFGGFLPMFLLHFWRFAPESVRKNSLDVRSGFLGVVLFSFGFFSSTSFFAVFCLRETVQVVTGHPLTRTCLLVPFFFLCPAGFACFARFGRASCFFVVFRGAILGPGILLVPSEAFFLGREAARVFLCFSCLVFFFPLCFLLRLHTFY